MVPTVQYAASSVLLVLVDRLYSFTHPKTMSLTSWSKRSPSNTSVIALVLIGVIGLNLIYRDRPNTEAANNVTDNGSAIAAQNISPKIKAFLEVISWAEGTGGADGYRTHFGYQKFDDFSDHPRKVKSADGHHSDAAGKYQAMSFTWDRIAKKIGLKDFSPASQDLFAIELLKECGAYDLIMQGNIEAAIIAASPTWASFPKEDGASVYPDQKARPMSALLKLYQENLEAQK
jgi:muramidase (phage lysozyme)